MERRYPALRVIATVYKVLGIIAGGLTVIGVIIMFFGVLAASSSSGSSYGGYSSPNPFAMMGGAVGGLMMATMMLIYGGGIAITLFAFGEGIYLLLAMEENTRGAAMLLQRQAPPVSAPAYGAPAGVYGTQAPAPGARY